jgi:N-acyl-D-amino-acid deacylase
MSPRSGSTVTVIRGGTVVDGSGAPGRQADVVVVEGRIVQIGPEPEPAGRVIDASGLVVAPGFIDMKTHSDWTLPLMPYSESKVRQGVTTEVVGHCGYSCAPVLAGQVNELRDYLAPSAPWLDFVVGDFASYLSGYPETSVNRVMLVGHNTLRLMALGMEDRPARPEEIRSMVGMLTESLDAGAFGLSTGLFTAPGSSADAEELRALGDVLRRYGAPYFTHLRDEAGSVFESVQEAIDFGATTGIHVQISHLKLSGIDNWGGAPKLLEMLAAARLSGIAIDSDSYPYTAASNPLKNLFPAWLQAGGVESMLDRLASRAVRDRLRRYFEANGVNNFGRLESWDAVRVSIAPNLADEVGRSVSDIARERRADPLETALDLLAEDRGMTRVLVEAMSEDDVQTFVRSPEVLVGSDGNALATYGPTSQGRPHPRAYGAFARILGKYVRELKLLPLHEAIRKMTGASATALGLADRGLLRKGFRADITVFDPVAVAEIATYEDPHRYAKGVEHVLVNGEPVIDSGEHTGARPGMLVRRGSRW